MVARPVKNYIANVKAREILMQLPKDYKHGSDKIYLNEDLPKAMRVRHALISWKAAEERNNGSLVTINWRKETLVVDDTELVLKEGKFIQENKENTQD